MHTRIRFATFAAPLALALVAGGCADDDGGVIGGAPAPTPAPTAAPTPTPVATAATYDVTPCFNQMVPLTNKTVAQLFIPDTLTMTVGSPRGFPNGRKLPDPVIDMTLALIFLDLDAEGLGIGTLAGIPVNPPSNDRPFRGSFPYLAVPQGNPPLETGGGSGFTFRNDPPSAYVAVDRTGMPALATALVGRSVQPAFNDARPEDDVEGIFVDEFVDQLTLLTNALGDDLIAVGAQLCAEEE